MAGVIGLGSQLPAGRARMLRIRYMFLMTVGEIFLESLSTGVITEHEVNWLASHQTSFDRPEEAAAIRLGRLMDQGQINLGCRLPEPMLRHQEVLVDWIEPLGRRRHRQSQRAAA